MKRRLIGGVLVAVILSFAFAATAQAFYIECWELFWGITSCWPF